MSNIIVSKLDAPQIIRQAYDETNNRIRVDAAVSATIGTLDVIIDASSGDNIAIADPSGTNFLLPNPDGSINTNVAIDQASDSIKLGDGVNLITSSQREAGEV